MTSYIRRLLFASFVACIAIVSRSSARTWFIAADGSGDAPTIQAGVDAASPGDIVLLGPGTYSDSYPLVVDGVTRQVNVHLTKDIVLTSRDGAAVTKVTGPQNSVLIFAENVGASAMIRGFDLRAVPAGGWACLDAALPELPPPGYAFSIRCSNCSCTITQNVLHGNYAIVLTNSPVTVIDNAIDKAVDAVYCDNSAAMISGNHMADCGTAIVANGSAITAMNNLIEGTTFGDMCAGIYVSASAATVYIGHNQFKNVYHEAIIGGAATLIIEENAILNCGFATDVSGASLTIRSNVISGAGGINIQGNGLIAENTILVAADGIDLLGGTPVVERNIISAGTGVWCQFASPILRCNDVFSTQERYHGCPDPTGSDGNISADPLFCGIPGSGNYQLQSVSPCAPGRHPDGADCGLIGALDVGCGSVKAEAKSWGAIKAMYRR